MEIQRGFAVWLTGLSGAGKTTLSKLLSIELQTKRNIRVEVLDGDIVRSHLSKGLGFSKEDRDINILRIGWVAGLLTRHGVPTVIAAISPYRDTRNGVRKIIESESGKGSFIEVFVEAPIEVCEFRDPKGLYGKARRGEIKNFTGIDDPYEPPLNPEIHLRTDQMNPEECLEVIISYLKINQFLSG